MASDYNLNIWTLELPILPDVISKAPDTESRKFLSSDNSKYALLSNWCAMPTMRKRNIQKFLLKEFHKGLGSWIRLALPISTVILGDMLFLAKS